MSINDYVFLKKKVLSETLFEDERLIENLLKEICGTGYKLGLLNGRSTIKTNFIHPLILDLVELSLGKYGHRCYTHFTMMAEGKDGVTRIPYDSKITGQRALKKGNYNADVLIERFGGTDTVISAKAPATSINQNLDSSANNIIGELARRLVTASTLERELDIVFAQFIPTMTYKGKGKIERVRFEETRIDFDLPLLRSSNVSDFVCEINVAYNIKNLLPTLKEYKNFLQRGNVEVEIENVYGIKEFITRFIKKNTDVFPELAWALDIVPEYCEIDDFPKVLPSKAA